VESRGERTYVGDTRDALALELATIELLDGGSQVGCGFKLNEASATRSVIRCHVGRLSRPKVR
jgi:hypothetical protein